MARGDRLEVIDRERLRGELSLSWYRAVESSDEHLSRTGAWLLWSASQALGCGIASADGLLAAIRRGELPGYRAPLVVLSANVFEDACAVFRVACGLEVGPILFDRQPGGRQPSDRGVRWAGVLAAAIHGTWQLPVLPVSEITDRDGLEAARAERHIHSIDLGALQTEDLNVRLAGFFEEASACRTVAALKRHIIPWPARIPRPGLAEAAPI